MGSSRGEFLHPLQTTAAAGTPSADVKKSRRVTIPANYSLVNFILAPRANFLS